MSSLSDPIPLNEAPSLTPPTPSWLRRAIASPLVLALVVFLLALGPRTADLAVFIGPDELDWLVRSASFSQALATGDLVETYQRGHPGVTLMWLETLGAGVRYGWQRLAGPADWQAILGPAITIAKLGDQRQVVAVVNALLLVGLVLAARRLFGAGAAWLAGFLLAFDPFFLTESRALRTEGLLTGFSSLALFSYLLYVREKHRRYPVLAGILTGLALLSKVSAVALLPAGLLALGVARPFRRSWTGIPARRWRSAGLALLLWGFITLLTVVLLWPALWVAPLSTLQRWAEYVGVRAVEGGPDGNSFFWGAARAHTDLGPFFYPVVVLYRTSPLLWAGLALLAVTFLSPQRRGLRGGEDPAMAQPSGTSLPGFRPPPTSSLREEALSQGLLQKAFSPFPLREGGRGIRSPVAGVDFWTIGLILVYLAAYLVLITRSNLKYDRYIIPLLPPLTILAAVGYAAAWRRLAGWWPSLARWGWLPALGLLALQAALALPYHPYYYTYWNPLLGGIRQAIHVLPVGAGDEGIEQAAGYLNSLPGAERLTVASTHEERLAPLFKGQAVTMTNERGNWYTADYTFIYIAQVQRERHDPELLEYLRGKPLKFVVKLAGLDYGWLYQGPGAGYFGGDTTLEGRATLHAYSLSATALPPGQPLTVTVYFRNEGQRPTDSFYVRLVDGNGYTWTENTVRPRPGFEAAFQRPEAIVEGDASLALPAGMPPGQYLLKLGYRDTLFDEPVGEFVLPPAAPPITITLPPAPLPVTSRPLRQVGPADLGLAGYHLEYGQVIPGETVWLTLDWQAATDVTSDYTINLQLLGPDGAEVAYWLGRPVYGSYPTNQWRQGQAVLDPWRLAIPAGLAPGRYTLQLTLFDSQTQAQAGQLALGQVDVVKRRQQFELPARQVDMNASLGDRVLLRGYNLAAEPLPGGGRLRLALYWQARQPVNTSYTVFVQLLNPAGTALVAQHDGLPAGGAIPTTEWAPGETITDRHVVEFSGLPPGEYRLVAGMYDAATGERLPTAGGETAISLQIVSVY